MATWKKVLLEGTSGIGDLSDVTITSASDAQILVHDGTDFDNVDVTGDVTITSAGVVTIGNDKVITAKILDGNVTTAKLDADAVTAAKLADNAVVTANIVDANVTTAKIADSNVTTAKIADSNVTLAKIANIADATVLGNASGGVAAPSALTIDADLSSVSANDDTLASAKAIKAYVDDQVASGYDLDVSADSGSAETITNAETLNLAGTANQISTATGTNSVVFSIPGAFIAPGSIAAISTITAATGLTVIAGGATITAGGLDVNGGAVTLGTAGTTVEGGGLTVSAGGADITGNTTIAGNLTVTGTTTEVQTETLIVEDKNVVLANPDTAYAADDTGAGLANDGANGGGLTLTSHHGTNEAMFAALNWSKTGQNLTGWTLRDTADYSTASDVAQTDFEIAIMDFNLASAAAPTGDAAGVGSFFFAQSANDQDGALYVRVQ